MNNFINGLIKENLKFYESKWDKTYKEIVEQIVKQVAEATANEIKSRLDFMKTAEVVCQEIIKQCKE